MCESGLGHVVALFFAILLLCFSFFLPYNTKIKGVGLGVQRSLAFFASGGKNVMKTDGMTCGVIVALHGRRNQQGAGCVKTLRPP